MAQLDYYETFLPNGQRVLFRRIRADNKHRLQDGLQSLSPGSRYLRFLEAINRLSDNQLHSFTEIDFEHHFAWLAVLPDELHQSAIAVGRWVRLQGGPKTAEVALTVLDRYQEPGVGNALLALLVRARVAHGIQAFLFETLLEDQLMMSLLEDLKCPPGRWESGVLHAEVPLDQLAKQVDAGCLDTLHLRPVRP